MLWTWCCELKKVWDRRYSRQEEWGNRGYENYEKYYLCEGDMYMHVHVIPHAQRSSLTGMFRVRHRLWAVDWNWEVKSGMSLECWNEIKNYGDMKRYVIEIWIGCSAGMWRREKRRLRKWGRINKIGKCGWMDGWRMFYKNLTLIFRGRLWTYHHPVAGTVAQLAA